MIKTITLALALIGIQSSSYSQAFDGGGNGKIFLGYANVEGKSGIEFQINHGANQLISYGGKFSMLINAYDETETSNSKEDMQPFDVLDFGLFLRLHFSKVFNLNERIDPFVSLEGGLKSAGANVGVQYNFGDTIGAYVMYNHSFSSSLYGDTELVNDEMSILLDKLNYFGKKNTISVGITFNVY